MYMRPWLHLPPNHFSLIPGIKVDYLYHNLSDFITTGMRPIKTKSPKRAEDWTNTWRLNMLF